MPNTQMWNYPEMYACADQLSKLFERSNQNKTLMDQAFGDLAISMQAEAGAAFTAAYAEHVPSIELFAQILESEAELLRSNANIMNEEDERIATEIRRMFGV